MTRTPKRLFDFESGFQNQMKGSMFMCKNYQFKKSTDESLAHLTVCPHGKVHLHYGQSTLHFSQEDFIALIKIANEILTEVNLSSQNSSTPFH